MDKMIKKIIVALITTSLIITSTSAAVFAEEVAEVEEVAETEAETTEAAEDPETETTDVAEATEVAEEEAATEAAEVVEATEATEEEATESAEVAETTEAEEELAAVAEVEEAAGETAGTVTLTFNGTDITSSDNNTYTALQDSDGDYYVEIPSGSYILTGSAENIYLSLLQGTAADFELNGLSVNNDGVSSAFISAAKSTTVNITLKGTSEINDGAGFVSQKKNSTLNISGSGSLNVDSPVEDAIKTKGTMNLSGGTLNLTNCLEDGIQAEDLNISGGTLNIDTCYANAATGYYTNGNYTSGSSTASNYLWTSGDTVKYERVNVDTGSHKGIKVGTKAKTYVFSDSGGSVSPEEASGTLNISGGTLNIDTRMTGLKANALSTGGYTAVSAGTYIIGSPDDAISSNNDIVISGGNISLYSADDGLSAMGSLSISGRSEVNIYNAYEGIEGQSVNIGSTGSPVINIWSSDDGINTSGKTLTYTYDSYSGYESDEETGYTKKTVSTTTGNDLTINGGTVKVYIDSEGTKTASLPNGSLSSLKSVVYRSSGDGLDCNGALTQNGGEIYVYGQSSGDNSPIDTNDGFTFNSGAKVVGAGTDGMNEASPEKGSGSYITYGSSGNNAGNNPPEMPGNSNSGTAPDMTGSDNGSTPPEMPGNNNSNTPPDMPGGYNGNTPPEIPGSENGNMPDGGEMQGSFSAGQYWVVTDSDSVVIDSGKLEYAGSFIVYGSPLIENGSYTLSITDTDPGIGNIFNASGTTGETAAVSGSFMIGSNEYEYSYTGNVSYNGLKLALNDFKINGQEAGTSLSGNVIFKKVRYKKNKNVGEAGIIPVFKAARGADSSTRKAVKSINKYFRANPLTFNITACELTDKTLSGSAVYKTKTGKWSFNLKTDTGASKLIKLKYKKDFTVVDDSYDQNSGTVMIQGLGNYDGITTVSGILTK